MSDFTIHQPYPASLRIDGADGRRLLVIHPDGRVEGAIEDATEAAAVFVRSLREQWGMAPPAKAEPVSDAQVEAGVLALIASWDGRVSTPDDHDLVRAILTASATAKAESVHINRAALRGAIVNVLCNASNFPDKVQARLLGQDMGPLIDRTTDAVIAHLAAQPATGTVETAISDYIDGLNQNVSETGEFGDGIQAAFNQAAMHIRNGSWKGGN